MTAVAALLSVTDVAATAGCKCNSSGATPYVASSSNVWAAINTDTHFERNGAAVHAPHPLQADGRRYPLLSGSGLAAGDSHLVPFVPGTLGQTYSRASHPIPKDKHPRIAMLAVRDHGRVADMSVQRMNGFRMSNGVWLFETDRPLIPSTENIFRVEVRGDSHDIQPQEVRFVRLIPGRLVYLDFR